MFLIHSSSTQASNSFLCFCVSAGVVALNAEVDLVTINQVVDLNGMASGTAALEARVKKDLVVKDKVSSFIYKSCLCKF